MESDLPLSDSESSTGSSGISIGILFASRATTRFQCSKCFRLFPSERALIQHQMGLCNFTTKALGFFQKCNFAQPAIPPPPKPSPKAPLLPPSPPPQRPYHYQCTTRVAPAPTPLSLSLMLNNTAVEGSGTNDPLGGHNDHKPTLKTMDLLSPMDPAHVARACLIQFLGPSVCGGYDENGAYDAATSASNEKDALDLDLKL